MSRLNKWTKKLAASAAVVAVLAVASSASAGHHCGCYTKKVTTYVTKLVPETSWVTYHDDCGKPYRVKVTITRRVSVPVSKWVKVCS